jgi:hypothetical protein
VNPVAVRLLHVAGGPEAGPRERALAAVRAGIAQDAIRAFRAAGASDVAVVAGPPDDTPFGRRLRTLAAAVPGGGLVVAGSGALALARPADLRLFVVTAASPAPVALANNRHSADVVAVAGADRLADLPDLPGDNALPRWLEEVAGYAVHDLRRRRRLQVDVDGPLDALLAGLDWPDEPATRRVRERLAAVAAVAHDRRAELVVAGRTSAGTLRWLERCAAARVRALVEERGLRAAAAAARADGAANRRPPRSVLGLLLDRDGPEALGDHLAALGDAAVVDSRVLLAHRLGADEPGWPVLEDRLASDLLDPEGVGDPWLRALTASAAAAGVPVLLGGHTAVGPGLPLVVGGPAERGA